MKLINILLVEDDQLDTIDVQRSLDKINLLYHMQVAKNGEEALEMLNGTNDYMPDVVLIDINMPKMDGLEFLQELRSSEKWKDLKCFIITTSDEKPERNKAKLLGVSGYIIKPLKLNSPSSMDSFNLMIDLMNV